MGFWSKLAIKHVLPFLNNLAFLLCQCFLKVLNQIDFLHADNISKMTTRSLPNILVTGTPGVGKSTLCEMIAEKTGLEWVEVSKIAKDNDCLLEYDNELKCYVLDEDKLLDDMEDMMVQGGKIVDYHGSSFFPERWFDIVFVLRTCNTILYDRLVARCYNQKKIQNNIESEIFNIIFDETYDSYAEEIVHQLQSNNSDELEENLEKIVLWIENWKKNKT